MARTMDSVRRFSQYSDLYVVLGIVLIIVMMILPLPPVMLDLLLATNISLALLVLLLTMNVKHPLELAVFPSLLLITTLFRLALNISSTRLILLRGMAGQIIHAFGNFVVGGNYVVGFVIFLILVVIQFVVIVKGSERVAEVAARFTLDAMPGKQMSIDADLNSGLITESEARERRSTIEREADFHGSMDGASKFVKGDAIAGIIITVINIIGGLAVGMGQRGLAFDQAVQRYTLLTVGDGLVSQIPALLISTATGIIITRAASEGNLGQDLTKQLLSNVKVLGIAAVVLLGFAMIPGLPVFPFFVLSALAGSVAFFTHKMKQEMSEQEQDGQDPEAMEESQAPENVLSLLQVDQIELEIGYSLIPLVDTDQGGDMLERITMLRRQCALELGMVVPVIRIRDNLQLEPGAYAIKIKGVEVAAGELMVGQYLAMDAGGVTQEIPGIPTKEPAFGLEALWIEEDTREAAENANYTVVDPPSVLATHLTEIIRSHAHELLGRQEVQTLLDSLKEDYSAVVEELIPNVMTVGEVQKVLQNLLREGVPIRNLLTILETLADTAPLTKDVDFLTEYVREALARQITKMYEENGVLAVLTLVQQWEETVAEGIDHTERGMVVTLDPRLLQTLFQKLAEALDETPIPHPIVLVSPNIRMALKRLTERTIPRLIVISYNEVVSDAQVQAVGTVKWPDAS